MCLCNGLANWLANGPLTGCGGVGDAEDVPEGDETVTSTALCW
jgi:hypothetical protein